MNPSGFAVAIDGPVGVGKSTVAQQLASNLHMTYIDTGAMYRAVALFNLRQGTDRHDATAIAASLPHIEIALTPAGAVLLNGEDVSHEIRNQLLAEYTSTIAAYAPVREKLTQQQKHLAANAHVVMDGRDIASYVLPWAQVKIYLDADVKIRAQRRYDELQAKGQPADFARVWEETLIRDERDKNRAHAPLVRTQDAIYIDTSNMSPGEMLEAITCHVKNKLVRKDG
ncbi:MAG: (d)CMP kinase [Defluviitaleaceae bacterium]|nr:(d)CMP kinase [Defluviitaleaceae bacterium]MCL2238858.1 (d)CMP kinase [Defluviitaleaceae bacterium]